MTDCNGCGACCDPVTLPWTLRELRQSTMHGSDETDRRFVLAHFRQLSRREGLDRAPWLKGRATSDRDGDFVFSAFYECDRFDRETRRCLAYDERPSFCRRYPWGDEGPHANAALPPMCSYRADLGQPVEEVPVEWRPARR